MALLAHCTSRTYNVPFLDGLPTVDRSFVRRKKCVLRKDRGQDGGIVFRCLPDQNS
jgi:hypothetical protein